MNDSVRIPIIELWGQLLVPLQGDVGDAQMHSLEVAVLERVRERGPEGLVLDVSGVEMMDSHLCAVLGRLATAARLMGTRPVICGLSPAIALTLEALDVDLGDIETALGLESALHMLGIIVEHDDPRRLDAETLGRAQAMQNFLGREAPRASEGRETQEVNR